MHLAALDQRGGAEGRPHRLVQRLRAIEDHQQAAVRAQAATLEIRRQPLTHFRRLKGCGDMRTLVAALRARDRQLALSRLRKTSREGDSTPFTERRSSFLAPPTRSIFHRLVAETAMT